PQSVKNTTVAFSNYTQNTVILHFNIPIIVECTGEAPENATVTIQCNGTVIFHNIYLIVNYQNNVTGLVPMPHYKSSCSVIIVFSNAIGRSEPFLLTFETTTNVTISDTQSSSKVSMPVLAGAIIGGIFAILVLIIFTCILVFLCYCIKKRKLPKDEVSLV
uniref:Uncharacterized protein n=1 Tax=Amphimedon queenslandica TaxID=400682 RepID=A0A1X7TCV8_AMPQE